MRRALARPALRLALCAWLACWALWPHAIPAAAQTNDPSANDLRTEAGLIARLGQAIERAKLGSQVGVSVVDARTGRTVFARNADTPLNPASNQKLITAAAALTELGPEFRMTTGLYGDLQGDAVVSGLYLKGHGDPTLKTADLIELGAQLVARGVRQVDEVVVDGTYFDQGVLPPGFEEQPEEISAFRASVAAASVNANAFILRVSPGASAGAAARVWVDAEGHFALTNELMTTDTGGPNVVAVQRAKDDKLLLKLTGNVPLGMAPIVYRRRVESPLHYTGYALVEALRANRIQVPRRVRIAATPKGMALLASRRSPPLSEQLSALGKNSDNFTAEMLTKVLGAERVGAPGSTDHGGRVVVQALRKLGVSVTGLSFVNGSGLFGSNRVSAMQLTGLLGAMYREPSLRPEYLWHLAIGGVDGTLAERFVQLPAPRVVRAKTGTLADVVALSGYVLGRTPERVFAFSVLANGIKGKQHAARALADEVGADIAWHLWTADKPLPRPKP
jgi:D-alanyl-D-alanine carboxypeptidase/D-alanyl-D-alanine-endopeptidase (penicillin-binding protein 4)